VPLHPYILDALVSLCAMQTGKCVLERQIHEKHIMDLQVSTDQTHFVTASNDRSAKLVDTQASKRDCCVGTSQRSKACNLHGIAQVYTHEKTNTGRSELFWPFMGIMPASEDHVGAFANPA